MFISQCRLNEADSDIDVAVRYLNKSDCGVESPYYAEAVSAKGRVYFRKGNIVKATNSFIDARDKIAICGNWPFSCYSLIANGLASAQILAGKLDDGSLTIDKWLAEIRARHLLEGPDHVSALCRQAELYEALGELTKSEVKANQCIARSIALYGSDNLAVCTNYQLLGRLYAKQGRIREAEDKFTKAISMSTSSRDINELIVARLFCDAACFYRDKGDVSTANSLFVTAMTRMDRTIGDDWPEMWTIFTEYASLLQFVGKESRAAEVRAAANDIRKERPKNNFRFSFGSTRAITSSGRLTQRKLFFGRS